MIVESLILVGGLFLVGGYFAEAPEGVEHHDLIGWAFAAWAAAALVGWLG